MTDARPCALGCRNADGIPYRAAPGLHTCHPCSDRLRTTLGHIEQTYTAVTAIDELIPSGHGPTGVRTPPGPRSPASDTLLVHSDPRTYQRVGDRPAALATITEWAKRVRADRSVDVDPDQMRATVPLGRITMARETATLRFNWDWIMGQVWVPDFADAMREALNALRAVDAQQARATRVGKCPVTVAAFPAADGTTVELGCGAWLRLKPGQDVITCRNCGHAWPRARWHEIGEQWASYAELARIWTMPAATLRGWAREDEWRTVKLGRRVVLLRADAVNTYTRRRGALPIGEAG